MLFLVMLFLCISFIMGELFLDTHEMSFLASFETKNNCSQVCLGFLGSSSEANRVFCAHQHWCWIVLQTAAGIFFLHPPLFLTTLCPMFYKQRAPPFFWFFLMHFDTRTKIPHASVAQRVRPCISRRKQFVRHHPPPPSPLLMVSLSLKNTRRSLIIAQYPP